MSPTQHVEDSEGDKRASSAEDRPHQKESDRAATSSSKSSAKRRTKTGCLTCRKRRIKCGEEKPFCKNCIKSKRDCAGYVQPLVYKQHNQGPHSAGPDVGDRGALGDHDDFQFNSAHNVNTNQHAFFNPFMYHGYHEDSHARHGSLPTSQGSQYPPPEATSYVLQSTAPLSEAYRRHSMHQVPSQYSYGLSELQVNVQRVEQPWSARSQQSSVSETTPYSYGEPQSNLTSPYENFPASHGGSSGYFPYDTNPLHEIHPRRYSVHGFVQASPYGATVPTLANPLISMITKEEGSDASDDYEDTEMEQPSDVEELGHGREQQFAELLGRQSKRTSFPRPDLESEKSRALQPTNPPITFSPLQDERNERIFCHFVEVTGRCMSIFERPPNDTWSLPPRTLWSHTLPSAAMTNPALAHAILALSGLHIAKLQHLSEDSSLKHFTYALRRVSNLLGLPRRRHEITTLATVLLLGFYEVLAADHSRWNLHLTGATKLVLEHDYTAPMRAVTRMRSQAKENILNFSKRAALTEANYLTVAGIPESLLDDEEWEVNEELVSVLVGHDVRYDQQVQPNFTGTKELHDLTAKDVADYKMKMDLRWWYCKQDVFQSMISGDPLLMEYDQWCYCPPRGRIGNANIPYGTFDHLLLLLARLTDFGGKDRWRKQRAAALQGGQWRPPPWLFPAGPPPLKPTFTVPSQTTPMNPASSPHYDTNMKTEDKLKPSPAPSANEGRVRQNRTAVPVPQLQQPGPSFHGMMPPPPAPPTMHSSFHAMNQQLQVNPSASGLEPSIPEAKRQTLEEETEQALAEHAAMVRGFEIFSRSLGPDFEPLANDGSFPQTSPFGPPLRYQSPAIATIWLHYYVGRVLLHRLHPHMPAAAMVSASVTAHLTREYAQTAGKVAAGLYAMTLGGSRDPLDPTYAGSLIESTFPLLFAAVQYQDASQRGWVISKLHDIARMTGWQTSGAVAAACEIAWERQGLAGKGPPYTRSLDRDNKDARVNGASRRVDHTAASGYSGPADAGSEQESQFVSHDRAQIAKHGPTRVHWALGLLSVEEDIKKLSIG